MKVNNNIKRTRCGLSAKLMVAVTVIGLMGISVVAQTELVAVNKSQETGTARVQPKVTAKLLARMAPHAHLQVCSPLFQPRMRPPCVPCPPGQ